MSDALVNIFTVKQFAFPYLYKFPGQASDERILFVTRESEVMLMIRQVLVLCAGGAVFVAGAVLLQLVAGLVDESLSNFLLLVIALIAVVVAAIGFWWVSVLWRRSIAIITNKRLSKFVYTTPWNRHDLSLPLDMIVDTGAYNKGFFQAIFKLGTFTARSSASSSGVATDDPQRINKKYFYIENVRSAEDIHHYLHKVLFAFRQDWTKLENFRPFLPDLKGEARKAFMQQYPEYWS